MTVEELITELSTLDPKLEVVVGSWFDGVVGTEVLEETSTEPAQALIMLSYKDSNGPVIEMVANPVPQKKPSNEELLVEANKMVKNLFANILEEEDDEK